MTRAGRSLIPLQRVRVSGPSMAPTLRDGDIALVWLGGRVRPGDVVLARFRSRPDVYVVKRVSRPAEGGWLLASDNPYAGGDSASYGVAELLGRVLVRWTRASGRARRRWPQRVHRHNDLTQDSRTDMADTRDRLVSPGDPGPE
jgi:signal peptidase I